ncbi:peptidyl-prolyl cis-trans isomerase FKBP18, chloroplastic isoform X2 [Cicer arietinum]|uniref:peptidyl-prolyl cis-trans isomerase FKBP18, chloroplastic isoform X2 n=1 Tax=Cicer arietinum TaxID=3827 RepID=UPI003CC565EF
MSSSSFCSCSCSSNSVSWLLVEKCKIDYTSYAFSNSKRRNMSMKRRALAVSLSDDISLSRRSTALLISSLPFTFLFLSPAEARDRRKKNNIPIDDYLIAPDGLKYFDFVEGKGPIAQKGSTVQVHFDCLYRGITAISSRESKLLAGNRAIAQPYEFKVGAQPGKERKREFVDNPNGLFSAQAAPKPPSAMYTIVEGMRVGGKRTVIVPPEKGYGKKGMNEIPDKCLIGEA